MSSRSSRCVTNERRRGLCRFNENPCMCWIIRCRCIPGYTFRTRNILKQQHARGWQTVHVTGSKHPLDWSRPGNRGRPAISSHAQGELGSGRPCRCSASWMSRRACRVGSMPLSSRSAPICLHAHSPALDGLAALAAGKRHGLPVVYECRAFWEDAAVDHGTTTQGSLRYRLTRAMETYVFRRADAVTCICEGLRKDIVERGVPEERVTVIPERGRYQQLRRICRL